MGWTRRLAAKERVLVLALLAGASPLTAQLGELPAAPIATESVRDVRVELSLRFWVDPGLISGLLPDAARLRTVESYAIPDSVIPRDFRGWIDASLVFLSADHIELDGRVARQSGNGATKVFWWLQADDHLGIDDPRALGNHQALELASWLTDPWAAQRWSEIGLDAVLAEAAVTQQGHAWHFSLRAPGIDLVGTCSWAGPVVEEDYALPAYSTVLHAGDPPTAFTVFTYQGHQSQRCSLTDIDISGDGLLATSLRASVQIQQPTVVLMDSWEARSRVYRRGVR